MRLSGLYERYRNEVEFLAIYIREAHPTDGWWFGKGVAKHAIRFYAPKVSVDVKDPGSLDERRAVANRCQQSLAYGMPTYVDDVDDWVNHAYAAWPTRLYLIGTDGRVVYNGGLGPFGFKPKNLGKAIKNYL